MIKRVLSFVLAVVLILGLFLGVTEFAPVRVHAASEMKPSADVCQYLKDMEGFAAVPGWDYSQWSVGFGNACPPEDLDRYLQEGIPVEEAHALFAEQISVVADEVNKFMDRRGITLNQHQFDAICCLVYSKGNAWMFMENEPVVMAILEGDTGNKLIAALSLTVYAGGDFIPYLMTRRLIEAEMYINGVYGRSLKDNYCFVHFSGNGGDVTRSVQGYDSNQYAPFYSTGIREGYNFVGWFTEPNGGTQVTELKKEHNGMTLYAHWEEKPADQEPDTPFTPVEVTITTWTLNIRSGPGTWYSAVQQLKKGDVITMTDIREVEGLYWGKVANGWISLAYTDYRVPLNPVQPSEPETPVEPPVQPEEPEPVSPLPEGMPMTGTVVGSNPITVYNGPHTSYPKLGQISVGQKVTITETHEWYHQIWGKCDKGWIRLDRYILLDGYKPLAHKVTVSVTSYYLYVRSGPGANFSILATPICGEKLEIKAILVMEDYIWGLFDGGWAALVNTDFDENKLSEYQDHCFEQWTQTLAPTCTQPGEESSQCAYCTQVATRPTQLAEHTYGQWYESDVGTCIQPGQQQRDCIHCGHRQYQDTQLGGHVLGQWYVATEATCITEGQERRDCESCDYHEIRATGMGDHSFGEWYEEKAATEQETGLERRDCQLCEHCEQRELPVLPHIYGDWIQVQAPTCLEEGLERRDCINCDLFETRVMAATGHSFGQWTQLKAPSCTEEGQQSRTCDVCAHTETQTLAVIGHSFGQWTQVKAPSCTEEGQQSRTCDVCAHTETQALAVISHSFGQWEVHSEPSCSAEGQERRTCSNCDHYESRPIEKTEHSFGQWYQALAPTYTQEGQERRDCENCDYYETKSIPCLPKPVEKIYGTLTGYSFLNIRQGLGTGYPIVGKLNYGDRVEILERSIFGGSNWARIDRGWICIDGYLTLETVVLPPETTDPQPPTENPEPVIKTYGTLTGFSFLNIRQGLGTAYPIVGKLNYGDRVEILERGVFAGSNWARIDRGWICIDGYLTLETVEIEPEPPVVDPEPPEENPEPVIKTYGTLTGFSFLNIRQGLGTGYPIVGKLNYGDRVEILERGVFAGSNWARIDRGWICIDGYLTLETVEIEPEPPVVDPEPPEEDPDPPVEAPTNKVYATVTVGALSIRAGAGTNFDRLGYLYYGARVEILEQVPVGNVIWGRYEDGWICLTDYTTLETENVEPEKPVDPPVDPPVVNPDPPVEAPANKVYATITVGALTVRAGAGTNFDRLGYLYYGERVEILEQVPVGSDIWGRYEDGWICLSYATLETVTEEEEAPQITMTVNTSVLNVRAGAGTSYDWVTSLTYGTEVVVLDEIFAEGRTWVRIAQGWVAKEYLI